MGKVLHSGEFHDQARQRPQAFTRQRTVGFVDVVAIILNRVRKTTQVELDEYGERIHPDGAAMMYTKQSFAEARQNLRPEALPSPLNHVLIQGYYSRDDYARSRGCRLPAVDGSVLELPNTPALQESLSQFLRPSTVMAFTGLVPRESSSGKTQARGPITKTGKAHPRHVLVESA